MNQKNQKRPSRGSVTIRDLANHLGVHPSSVSRALNPNTRKMITPELAERVQKAAEELGYVPNTMAYALKKGYSSTIGVIIPDIMNPVFPPIIKGIQSVLDKQGYTPIITFSENSTELAKTEVSKLRSRNVDGFIMACAFRDDPSVNYCIEQQVPLVLVNRTVDQGNINEVLDNDARGIELAVKHLAALGHKRIAHIAGPQNISGGHVRYQAFIEALKKYDIEVDPDLVVFADAFTEEGGCKATTELLSKGKPFTAVIGANDLIALGCIKVMGEHGKRCPDDISVIGFNDMPYLDWFRPPLTTIAIPHFEMGEQAARLLLEQLETPDSNVKKVLLEPRLVQRGSTQKPTPTD